MCLQPNIISNNEFRKQLTNFMILVTLLKAFIRQDCFLGIAVTNIRSSFRETYFAICIFHCSGEQLWTQNDTVLAGVHASK